jgi:hypothetical protein
MKTITSFLKTVLACELLLTTASLVLLAVEPPKVAPNGASETGQAIFHTLDDGAYYHFVALQLQQEKLETEKQSLIAKVCNEAHLPGCRINLDSRTITPGAPPPGAPPPSPVPAKEK